MPPRRRKYNRGAHLFTRGRVYYSRVPGLTPAEVSLRTTDRAEAEKRHAERILAARDGRPGGSTGAAAPATSLDLADLGEQFLTAEHDWTPRSARSARHRVLAFLRWCAVQVPPVETVSDLTDNVLDQWIVSRRAARTRKGTPTSSTTIARDWKMVRRWFRWCALRKLCGPTPFAERPAPREPTRAPEPEIPHPREIALVATWLRRRKQEAGALAVEVLVACGMRRGELRILDAERITEHEIRTPPGKGKRERVVPVDPRVAKAALRFVELRDARKGRCARLDDHWSRDVLAVACKAVKVKAFGAHDLRRVFATVAFRGGVPIQDVQRYLGHLSAATTQRYIGRLRGEAPKVAPLPPELTIARPMSHQSHRR